MNDNTRESNAQAAAIAHHIAQAEYWRKRALVAEAWHRANQTSSVITRLHAENERLRAVRDALLTAHKRRGAAITSMCGDSEAVRLAWATMTREELEADDARKEAEN